VESTPSLNLALSELIAECDRQGLKLVLIYEGLDVNRNPIPTATVASDLLSFEKQYASDPPSSSSASRAVIWSGSWRFSDADVSYVRGLVGAPDKMLLLGSRKKRRRIHRESRALRRRCVLLVFGRSLTTLAIRNA